MGIQNGEPTISMDSIDQNLSIARINSDNNVQSLNNDEFSLQLEDRQLQRLNFRDTKSVKLPNEEEKMIDDNDDDDEYEWVVPDGGWGWLVLFGAMLVNILIPGGAIKSFGILFVEFIEDLHATPSAASWIPAVCYFLYSSLGPLSSILSVKYSYRTVTIVGGTFAAVGMILTYWATSIEYLYISYGVFVGTGAGLSFPPTVYIVTSYFSRFRGLANGLCISGSALGSIILPPVLRILLDSYGYRGACLIMGGITMNVWLAALFYDPVEKHMKRVKVKKNDNDNIKYGKSRSDDKILEELEEENGVEDDEPMNGAITKKAKFIFSHDDSTPVSTPTMDYKTDVFKFTKPNGFERSASAVVVPNIARAERSRKISTPIREHNRNDTFCSNLSSTPSLAMESSSNLRLNRFNLGRTSGTRQRTTSMKHSPSTSSFQYVSTPYHGTLSSLQPNEFASHLSLKSIASSMNPITKKKDHKDEDEEIQEQTNCNKFFDLTLLTNPKYLIILISNCTNAIGYTNFIILLPAYAIELGFNKDLAAYLLSIVSTFDLIGRIGGSALSDLNLIPKTWFFVGGLCISGIGLTFLPLVSSYFWVSVLCSIFGLATGVYVGITAIVMADALGTERLTSSYGISLFVNGILQLVGPPICLNIFERIGVYQPIFTVLGLCLLFGSSLWCFMPCVLKKEKQDQLKRKAEENLLA